MRTLAVLVSVILGVSVAAFTSGQEDQLGRTQELARDLAARREVVARELGTDTVLVLWSAPRRTYSANIDYEYRQESNLLYLTGVDEEQTTLVLMSGADGARPFLFVRASDPFQELWNGPIPSAADIAGRAGVDPGQVFAQQGTEAFDAFFRGLLSGPRSDDGASLTPAERAGAAASPSSGPLKIAMLAAPQGAVLSHDPDLAQQVSWAQEIQTSRAGTTVINARELLHRVRRVKTPYEQQVMRRAVEIAAEAHIEGMKATRPGRWEYEIEAAIEHWFLKSGAMSWGYPSIVGSGPNATILHYTRSSRRMQAGELVLVDAGANFQGLTGDITRTWPVDGRFSDDQRAIYDLVLSAQEAGIAAARPGGSVAAINAAVRVVLGQGLLRLGLVTDPDAASGRSPQINLWFPHGPVHGIGMDVHESLGALVPGVTFVVEPGIYVRPDTLDRLANQPEQAEFVRAVRPAVERFRHIGVRIEDSLLMTSDGPEVLSAKVPKRAGDVERLVGTGQ